MHPYVLLGRPSLSYHEATYQREHIVDAWMLRSLSVHPLPLPDHLSIYPFILYSRFHVPYSRFFVSILSPMKRTRVARRQNLESYMEQEKETRNPENEDR